jgi:hypothetical protein
MAVFKGVRVVPPNVRKGGAAIAAIQREGES